MESATIRSILSANLEALAGLMPELILTGGILLIILLELFLPVKNRKILPVVAGLVLILCMHQVLAQWELLEKDRLIPLFPGMLSAGRLEVYFKFLFALSGLLALALSAGSGTLAGENRKGEFLVMVLGVALGSMLLVMAENLIVLYLCLELVSLSSYVLVAFTFGKKPTEAAFKYFIFGTIASGIMLYGFSFLYGLTGTLQFTDPAFWSAIRQLSWYIIIPVILFSAGGFLFKVASFPFHLWAPDVYEGAPAPVAGYLSVAPKIAALVPLISLFFPLIGTPAHEALSETLILLSFTTLAIGNFAALWQNNAKRLLAYSSIAHTGFLFMGLSAVSVAGMESVTFYVSVYLVMNFAAFLAVDILSDISGSEDVRNFKGMGIKFPLIGVIFVLIMVALTGLPPTAGFYAKLFVFSSVWETWKATGSEFLFYLLIFGIFNAVVSLFYYLKIPYFMFFKASDDNTLSFSPDVGRTVLLSVLGFVLLIIFFQPGWLLDYINAIGIKTP